PSLVAVRADWVLKSDYGCEGTEVIIGADVDDAAWSDALRHARRGRWIVQRYFAARRDGDGRCANVGVYVVGGEASGFFSRLHRGATDYHATTVATLIERQVTHG
ncbi:MAG: glutathionylspermidine synthase family protein, partial [Polyangia bacterium]